MYGTIKKWQLKLTTSGYEGSIATPVPGLLRTNRAPTESEATLIRHAITTAEMEMLHMRTNRSSSPPCSEQVRSVEMQIAMRKDFIRTHTILLSSFRHFPPELLTEIFFHCVDEEDDPKSNEAPWKLGHVCHHWRRIALDAPSLWANLPPTYLGTLKKAVAKRLLARLSTLLERSSDAVLSFHLYTHHASPLDTPILDLLLAHCERWEKVSLEVSGVTVRQFLRVKGRLNSLRSLTFCIRRSGEQHLDLFEAAPMLTKVNLHPWDGMLALPWSQLTDFEEESPHVANLAHVLNSSIRLKFLAFASDRYTSWSTFQEIPDIQPTTLSCLTFLSIQMFHPSQRFDGLLLNLTLPVLRTLTIRCFGITPYTSEVIGMLKRNSCTVQHLTFHTRALEAVELVQLLTLTSSLVSLDINDPEPGCIKYLGLVNKKTIFSNKVGWVLVPLLESLTVRLTEPYRHLAQLFKLARLRCDTLSLSENNHRHTMMLKTFRIASSVSQDYVHLYPAICSQIEHVVHMVLVLRDILQSISSPQLLSVLSRKERINLLSLRIESAMISMESLQITEENAGLFYLSSIDYTFRHVLHDAQLLDHAKVKLSQRLDNLVARWNPFLRAAAPNLKWDWDDDEYLVYIPETDRISGDRKPPKFRCDREFVHHDSIPALKVFYWPA
ncbi:hypothetical protein B0H34DRAFT_795548 [Crassisporium funariophilum]|nr:hypothetical protein B0H34DRAFT_795548 [Crassisporium funariophilum]